MKNIIRPPVSCNVIGYESKGQHASDLVDFQEIFKHSQISDRNIVAITLEATKEFIGQLIKNGNSRENIISLSSLMRQSPGGITPLHFLFGPGTKDNRKLAVGTNRKLSPFTLEVLDKCESEGIKIVETDVPRHDRCSGFIQGLTNCVQLLIGDQDNVMMGDDCMKKWKTSASTVFGLMYNNADAELAIHQFFEELKRNNNDPLKAFLKVVEGNIGLNDIEDFKTPNFERFWNFAHAHRPRILISADRIEKVRSHLNADGEKWVPAEISRIRSEVQRLGL